MKIFKYKKKKYKNSYIVAKFLLFFRWFNIFSVSNFTINFCSCSNRRSFVRWQWSNIFCCCRKVKKKKIKISTLLLSLGHIDSNFSVNTNLTAICYTCPKANMPINIFLKKKKIFLFKNYWIWYMILALNIISHITKTDWTGFYDKFLRF